MLMNEEIKNKLRRGLALTIKESWDLYKYIEALEQTELNPSYNSVKTELEPCEDWKFYYKHGYAQARNDVLDKIRTEITDWQTDIHDNENDAEIHDFIFERIYEILDEYKAESEGDENGVCSL